MDKVIDVPAHYQQAFSDINTDDESLQSFRKKNWLRFAAQGLPALRDEDWRYTAIAKKLKKFSYQQHQSDKVYAPHPVEESRQQILMVDGQLMAASTELVNVVPLIQAADYLSFDLFSELDKYTEQQCFRALGNALCQSGILIHVPAGTKAAQLEALFARSIAGEGSVIAQRMVIVVEENAELDLLQHFYSDDNRYANQVTTDIILKEGAKLKHQVLQEEGKSSVLVHSLNVQQAAKSQYHAVTIDVGAQMARHDVHVYLNGVAADVKLHGVYLGNQNQHHDNHSTIHHNADNATSEEYYRGVLDDKAVGVFNGKIIVKNGVKQTVSKQTNNNLLLSPKAKANTKPELQIYADDVVCSHGATVGELDQEQVFYLQARGIDQAAAKKLLLSAFVLDVLKSAEWADVRETLNQRIMSKLEQLG